MKSKAWLKYSAYILIIFGLIFLECYVNPASEEGYYRQNVAPYYYLIPVVINIGIGFLLGLDHFFNERKKSGSWKINLPKIILMGIPSLYFAFPVFGLMNMNSQSGRIGSLGKNWG